MDYRQQIKTMEGVLGGCSEGGVWGVGNHSMPPKHFNGRSSLSDQYPLPSRIQGDSWLPECQFSHELCACYVFHLGGFNYYMNR